MFRSFAQNLEDVVLWRGLGHVEHGTYVDVGAADPDDDSVTRAFYERGWSGLNVEPVVEYVDRLRAVRPRDVTIDACAGSRSGRVELATVIETGLSSVSDSVAGYLVRDGNTVEQREVRVAPLDALLVEAGFDGRPIHFLKIDVEGYEEEVVKGLALDRWRPWVLVVESTHPRTGRPTHGSWQPLVLEAGYRPCLFDGLNRFYVSPEHPELIETLSYPACVLDHPYTSPPHQAALDELERVLGEHDKLESTHQEVLAAYERQEAELARACEGYERQEAELARFSEGYERQEAELARVRDAYEQAAAARDRAEAAIATQRAGVQRMEREIEDLRRSLDELRTQLERAEARAAEAIRVADQISGSTIWRLSAPVRVALDVARRPR